MFLGYKFTINTTNYQKMELSFSDWIIDNPWPKEVLWLKGLMKRRGIKKSEVPLFCDCECHCFGKESCLSSPVKAYKAVVPKGRRVAEFKGDISSEGPHIFYPADPLIVNNRTLWTEAVEGGTLEREDREDRRFLLSFYCRREGEGKRERRDMKKNPIGENKG